MRNPLARGLIGVVAIAAAVLLFVLASGSDDDSGTTTTTAQTQATTGTAEQRPAQPKPSLCQLVETPPSSLPCATATP